MVDIDLESFFDEVNHDMLMGRVRRRVKDKRMLKLIRAFLRSGLMEGGLTQTTDKGTPQGGPLSPLLSNILLNDLDKELEKRGHSFCRYADDCNIYVATRRSGERVMESMTRFIETKLKLKVNRAKSAVDWPTNRSFLGFSFTIQKKPKIRVPNKSVKKLKGKRKELFREGRGRNLFFFIKERLNPVLRGWINYFRLATTKGFVEELDSWIRRRLRATVFLRARLIAGGLADSRVSVGIGSVDNLSSRNVTKSTGEAFSLSGEALDTMKHPSRLAIAIPDSVQLPNGLVAVVGQLCDALISDWTQRQAEIVSHAVDPTGPIHEDIAAALEPPVTRVAVTRSLSGAHWEAIISAIRQFEALPWK